MAVQTHVVTRCNCFIEGQKMESESSDSLITRHDLQSGQLMGLQRS